MIGMRAFIATPPGGITDPATVLPVQIFLWSDEVSKGFVEKTSAAIIVLLAFLLAMNGLAIYLRNRSEEHTSELQSLMRISYAVFCLKKKKNDKTESL